MLLIDSLFPHGAPGAVVLGWADDCVAQLDGADAIGADKAPALAMPPFPAANDSGAVRSYLAETWRVVATTRKSWGTGKSDARTAYARILALPATSSPQAMISDAIKAGPLPSTPGADKWYQLATMLQSYVRTKTGEPSQASSAGLVAAQALTQAAKTIKAAAVAATKTPPANAPKGTAEKIAAFADRAQDRALAAIKAVTAVPGDVAATVATVPKHLADQVQETADHYLEVAREVVPQVADAGARASLGVGVGVTVVGGLVVLGLGAVFLGPEIATGAAAYQASKSSK